MSTPTVNNRWKNAIRSAICRFPDCPVTTIYCQHYCRRHYDHLWRRGIPVDTYPIRKVLDKSKVDRELGEAPRQPRQRYTPEELMAEWEFLRGWIPFEDFGEHLGIKQGSWERAFFRAKTAGDPRARRALNDPASWPDPCKGVKV